MSTTTPTDKKESDGLTDCGPWQLEQTGETFRWTHPTGAVVEVREVAAMRRDPYGGTPTGYRAVARPAIDAPVTAVIVDDGGHLPCRRDAVAAARDWMQDQPDGNVEDRQMYAEMDAAATECTTEYACLHGCGFSSTSYREFQQHRSEAGHELHGHKQRLWPR